MFSCVKCQIVKLFPKNICSHKKFVDKWFYFYEQEDWSTKYSFFIFLISLFNFGCLMTVYKHVPTNSWNWSWICNIYFRFCIYYNIKLKLQIMHLRGNKIVKSTSRTYLCKQNISMPPYVLTYSIGHIHMYRKWHRKPEPEVDA